MTGKAAKAFYEGLGFPVGAAVTKKPQDTFWGGYSGYFRAPDGFYWEIAWNPHTDLT